MQSSFNWLAILLLIGAAHALLLALTLLNTRSGHRAANRLLALILIVFAIQIGLHIMTHTHFILQYPHFSKVASPIVFLLPPLFYFYARALTTNETPSDRRFTVHFIPFLIAIVYHTPYYLKPVADKIAHIKADYEGVCTLCHVNYWFSIAQMLVYLVVIVKMLLTHSRRINDSFSFVEKINLNWLKLLFVAFSFTWILSLLLQFFNADQSSIGYVWLVVSANIYLIGYLGLKQPVIFSGANLTELIPPNESKKKYEKSTLQPEKAEQYLEKLLDFMKREKPFLSCDLTLQELAKRLAISHHHLSQIINEKLHQNFFGFVNSYRVEEAKKLLAEPENRKLNIAQMGFDAGFNSISAFNAAFKKHAGMTPSQYFEQATPK